MKNKKSKNARNKPVAKKESWNRTSSLAASILGGKKPTKKQAKSLAGSVLSQDETKGKRKGKRKKN